MLFIVNCFIFYVIVFETCSDKRNNWKQEKGGYLVFYRNQPRIGRNRYYSRVETTMIAK